MGQTIRGVSGSPPLNHGPDEADAPKAPSIGRYLARQRKLRGMELDEVVALTRVPRRSLERLESGAFDGLSDGFVRGFVRTVAVAIGLDPDETVARLLAEPELAARRRWPRVRALIGIAMGLGLLALSTAVIVGGFGASDPVVEAAVSPGGVEAADSPGRIADEPGLLRRDPVRELAEEQRALRQE